MTRHYCLDARTVQHRFPGIGRYTFNLARSLGQALEDGERLTLLRDPTGPSHWDLTSLRGNRVAVIDVPASPFSARQHWQVPRTMQRSAAHVYHSPYYLMPLHPGVPAVVTIYDLIPLRSPQHFRRWQRALFSAAVRLAARTATRIIAVSNAAAGDLRTLLGVPEARVAVTHLAADPAFAPQPPDAIDAVRRRFDLPGEYVLCVGSNRPHKNLPRLVDAWSRLQPQRMPLAIAGAWDRRYPVDRQQAESRGLAGAVRFLGPIAEEDLPALYSGATLFVLPSEHEGFGLPLLEAMACGVPTACADSGSLPEVAGTAAARFDPADTDGLAALIDRLLRDGAHRGELRRRGLDRARQFSWDRTARQTLEAYRNAAR